MGSILLFLAISAVFKIFYAVVPVEAWLAVIVFSALLCLLGMALLCHLLGFHVYLCEYLNLTCFVLLSGSKIHCGSVV